METRHQSECAEALETWARRRQGDLQGYTLPRQNVWQIASRSIAIWYALDYLENICGQNLRDSKVLDVGCASGYGLNHFLVAGFSAGQLHGVDHFQDRIAIGNEKCPGLQLRVGDAAEMEFADGEFDIVSEQFCFCHIMDNSVRARIAREMIRVVKKTGHIIIFDWNIGSKSRSYNSVSKAVIRELFQVGVKTMVVKRFRGQLYPPVGRFLSRFAPFLYPLTQTCFPFLVGSHLTILRPVE